MSLRSAMAEHFGNLERMQGGGVATPTPGTSTPTPGTPPKQETDPILRLMANVHTRQEYNLVLPYVRDYLQKTPIGATSPSLRQKQEKAFAALVHSYGVSAAAPVTSKTVTGGTAGGGAGGSLLSGLQKILGQAKGVSSTLGEAAKAYFSPGGAGYDNTVGGDTYHAPEWRPGELELMQEQNQIAREAQAATQRSDRATLAERMGEIEAAEQQSRRTSLLEAAQALFTAASTAAWPGMTTYPGFEPGGLAERSAKLSGGTVSPELQAPITRKPVSFDVLNAFDLGPLKEQIAAIMMGVSGAKKGLVSMASGGVSASDQADLDRYKANVAGKSPDEIALINRYLAGLGGGTNTSANSIDAIIGQAIREAALDRALTEEEIYGATIPSVRNAIAQTMGYNDTGQPTMDMRSLLASTKANPRNIIEGLFLGRGMGLPADLSNVEAVEGGWQVPGAAGGGGGGGTAATDLLQGASSAADLAARQARNPSRWQAPSGSWWQSEGDYDRQMARNVVQRASSADALARMRAGTWTGKMAAEGKVVSGPAISTVGERGGDAGTEYAFLPPGAVVAPKPAGEKPSMDGALRAIAAQLFKSGLGGMATGGSVMGSGATSSPTVTGSLPRSLLDAPALKAFMSPSNAGLPSVHKMPALFQPFGAGGPEAPNWLDPRAILAYAHADPTERGTMESITSAYGWDPATALEMARRAMAGFGKPLTGTASYRPYWSW